MGDITDNGEPADIFEIPEFTSISQEAKYLGKRLLSHDLIEIFTGTRDGTSEQKNKLDALTSRLGNGIYVEIVYSLTHTLVRDKDEARKIYEEIIAHKTFITGMLNRNISVEVAALDYLQGVRNMLKEPTIIEADKCDSFAYRSIMDETTQVYEKGLLDTDLDAEIERSRRFNVPFSILFIDIDNLKHLNDTYGHELGTRAILFVTECVKKNLRKYDSIYRYGGDEFVVLLSRADTDQANAIAQRIIDLIHEGRVEGLSNPPGISIGLASYTSGVECDKQGLLSAADTALYRAKDAGKNRICIYSDLQSESAVCQQLDDPGNSKRVVLKGIPLVKGIGIGRSFGYRDVAGRETEIYDIEPEGIEKELARVDQALQKTRPYISRIRKSVEYALGNKPAQNKSRLEIDPKSILKEIEDEMRRRQINAEQIVRGVFHQIERRFRAYPSKAIREHANQVSEICNRILRLLTGTLENPLSTLPDDIVIFARRLLPADTVHFDTRRPAAIITRDGGVSSHSAVIARAMDIPSVSRLPMNIDDLPQNVPVIVDGYKGLVVLNPTEEEIDEYRRQKEALLEKKKAMINRCSNLALTYNNSSIRIHATVSGPQDIATAIETGCDGIGLCKIEPLFMRSTMLPSEGELFQALYQNLQPAASKEITIRLPDLGGDRRLPYINQQPQNEPALGLKGIRFLLRCPIILEIMLRVCIRLSAHFDIRILIPTVTLPEEIETVRRKLKREMALLEEEKVRFNEDIAIGAMIETPSAVMSGDQIMRQVDFFSIDSTDLIQYTIAADRENLQVADYYERGTEIAFNMVRAIVNKSKNNGLNCTLCGRLASDMRFTQTLLAEGLTEFCVLPPIIPDMKQNILSYIRGDAAPI